MIYDIMDYNYHDCKQKASEWAANVKLAKEGGKNENGSSSCFPCEHRQTLLETMVHLLT